MKPTWKKYLLYGSAVIVGLALILAGYSAAWTGFGDYTTPDGDFVRGKTLWDWLELLVIPLVLGIGAFFLNRSERKNELEIATDRQQETALQAYLDRVAELLLEENLLESETAVNVVRIRTLTVLRGLDSRRKGFVTKFLHGAGLITGEDSVVSLGGADLRGADLFSEFLREVNFEAANLEDANLGYAILEMAFLVGAILNRTNLLHAKLSNANLQAAVLQSANLELADLQRADLQGAVLTGAILKNADLSGAILRNAYVSDAQLATVKYLKGTIMPDGTIHE
jgi:uncharacterized protein YjbI with pentapeptide repeats